MHIWKGVSNILSKASSRLIFKGMQPVHTEKPISIEDYHLLSDNLRLDTSKYEVYMIPKHPEMKALMDKSIEIIGSSTVMELFFLEKEISEVIYFLFRGDSHQ